MPGCPVRVINQEPCNWNVVVQLISVQYGHQDAGGNITEVEKVAKDVDIRCNQEDGVDTARANPNVGIISIICRISVDGQQRLVGARVDTEVPGQPLPGATAVLKPAFEYEMHRGETDVEKVLQSMRFGAELVIRKT
jgi:hypothetical protein